MKARSLSFREAIEKGLEQRGGGFDIFHPFLDHGALPQPSETRSRGFPERSSSHLLVRGISSESGCGCWRIFSASWKWIPLFRRTCRSAISKPAPDVALDPADRAFLIEFYREDVITSPLY